MSDKTKRAAHIPAALFLLSTILLLSAPGCTSEEVGEISAEAAEAAAALAPAAPPPYSLYLTTAASILSAISGIAFAVHRWGVARNMRKAIETRADSIDHAKVAADPVVRDAARKTLEFVKEFELMRNPSVKKSGGYFDAIRKGLK